MITIFIPVRNESLILKKNINKVVRFLKNLDYFIIFGENGSTDNSLEIIKNICAKDKRHFGYVSVAQGGVGSAFKAAIIKFKFNSIVSVDADLPVDLDFITTSKKYINQGYDMVAGYKKRDAEKRSIFRKFISYSNVIVCKLLLGLSYHDYAPGAKAYSGKFIKSQLKFIDDQSFFVTKIFYFNKKAKIKSVPLSCFDKRKSQFNIIRLSLYIFFRIFKLAVFKR